MKKSKFDQGRKINQAEEVKSLSKSLPKASVSETNLRICLRMTKMKSSTSKSSLCSINKQEIEAFASEKIMEKKGGFLQALNEPFCPPSMQFFNPKGATKKKQEKAEQIRSKRKEIVEK